MPDPLFHYQPDPAPVPKLVAFVANILVLAIGFGVLFAFSLGIAALMSLVFPLNVQHTTVVIMAAVAVLGFIATVLEKN